MPSKPRPYSRRAFLYPRSVRCSAKAVTVPTEKLRPPHQACHDLKRTCVRGRQVPKTVRLATDDYLADQDVLSAWIEESIELDVCEKVDGTRFDVGKGERVVSPE
jgi:hypothetical protein